MDFMGESVDSADGDDDKIYFFFSENAVEYDFYSKVVVSRVGRVCKVKTETFKTQLDLCNAGLVLLKRACISVRPVCL